jgi:type VI secretion system protein ImpH
MTEKLAKEFYRYNFFQAVSLLERSISGKRTVGEAFRPQDEPVRFKVKPGFAFPASDIADFRMNDAGTRVDMDVTFMGLIGPCGVLPHWYNDMALEKMKEKDTVLADFFDIFHHRLISLFYLAWKRSRLAYSYTQGGEDRFSLYFSRMIGLSNSTAAAPEGISAESLLYFSGLLSRQVPSVAAIESAVSHFAGQKAKVRQFIERMLQLPPEEQTRLGKANSILGESTLCGSLVWENQSKFRVDIGPMGSADFVRFLPGVELLRPIFSLVRFIVGIEYEFDLCIILKRDQIASCCLGGGSKGVVPMLGWNTWLKADETMLEKDQRVIFQESDAIAACCA